MKDTCPINYELDKCSSKDYGLTYVTCCHNKERETMKKFEIVFYHYHCCQTQTFHVIAKDEDDAKRLFLLENGEDTESWIEYIGELHDHYFYTEEKILEKIKRHEEWKKANQNESKNL
jgi:hypothetical protein